MVTWRLQRPLHGTAGELKLTEVLLKPVMFSINCDVSLRLLFVDVATSQLLRREGGMLRLPKVFIILWEPRIS